MRAIGQNPSETEIQVYRLIYRYRTYMYRHIDGSVSSKEVSQIMIAIGQNPSEAEIQVCR